jgi:hypothetical protein
MAVSNNRRSREAPSQSQEPLPLRWAVILTCSVAVGAIVSSSGGAAAGILGAACFASAMHALIE